MHFKFIHKDGLRMFQRLLQIVIDHRYLLPVLEPDILEFRIRIPVNGLSVDRAIVVYKDNPIRCHIHIELAAPDTGLLGASQRRH